jgi:ATP-dependent exoDNAse (exonuclease V) beta subunit
MTDSTRDRIVGLTEGSLQETIYAGAGAGTGKTQALVERIANLFTIGGVKAENIAAVTFTVAAASELRQRVREELERRLARSQSGDDSRNQTSLSKALDSLDSAFIGTIHSFAQSILRERPLAVGLPPVFELYDSVQGDTRFDEEWSAWLDEELANSEFSDAVVTAQRLGLAQPLTTLRKLAEELHDNYDLVARIGALPQPEHTDNPQVILESVRADISKALDLREYCTNSEDRLLAHLETAIAMAVAWIDEALVAKSANPDEEQILTLTQLPKLTVGGGRKVDWNALPDGDSSLEEIRTLLKTAQATLDSGRRALGESTVVPLVNAVSRMVLDYAEKRRSEGVLEFQDLLVLSCELLDSNEKARRYFHARYTHILIDEFQDTDPLQLKLAMRLADRGGNSGISGQEGSPTPGALFVVGDGKQSIYRFRRADLTQLQSLVGSLGATRLALTDNYRSDPGILNWVNAIFGPWMNGPDGSAPDPNQAEYVSLDPGRNDYFESDKPRMMIAGGAADGNVEVAREAESADLANLALSVGAGVWTLPDGEGGIRQSSYRDLCVLMPRRTALSYLENAFIDNGVPYVLEGQAPVFESQTVHDLSNNLVAIDDPTDQVAIVAALKSMVWGCSDQDLYEWAKSGRKFEYARETYIVDDFAEGSGMRSVAVALAGLAGFHAKRQQFSTPYLIEQFVRDRHLREIAALSNPEGDRERLMDLFIEMSRSLQRSGTGSLREFVRWLSRQAEARVRIAEGALANGEVNAVRVMTVHAAKGLEFPIVALMGLQTSASADRGSSITKEELGEPVMSVRLGSAKLGLATFDYADRATASKEADAAEQVRLAYVGATRAREHLIVSVHRSGRDKSTLAARIGELDEGSEFSEAFEIEPVPRGKSDDDPVGESAGSTSYSLNRRNEWIDELEETVSRGRNRGYVTPSQLANHDMFEPPKPEDNMESTERNTSERGRGGTSFGSAVHAVLQDVDFDDQENLIELVNSAAIAHDVPDAIDEIAASVRNVLASPVVAGANSRNSWREAWVAAEVSDGAEVEGSIDLVVSNDDGTVTIVDYKTDRVVGQDLIKRATGYEPQLAGYALVLEKLGMPVRDAVLVFANGGPDDSAYEYFVADLEAAKAAAVKQIVAKLG